MSDKFSTSERRAVVSLASLYAFRMLGLFMVLPVLVLYAADIAGSTPMTIGLALGAYGVTQALLQLPLGMLSDRIGRKPVIVGGLLVFALGSLVAAAADSMLGIIVGRALQGAGAIASTLMALLADLTRDQNRSKAMAAVGASIGMSFALALVLGPLLSSWFGLSGLFLAGAVLAGIGLLVALYLVPTPLRTPAQQNRRGASLAMILPSLRNPELRRLNLGVFVLHFIVTAMFMALPSLLQDGLGLERGRHGILYLTILLLSFLAMVPLMILAERRQKVKSFVLFAIVLLGIALLGFALVPVDLYTIAVLMFLFFVGFNYLEANLPSLLTRGCSVENRGTAMGLFSTSQFFGAFLGGTGGGLALQLAGNAGVFLLCALLVAGWAVVALGMQGPNYWRSLTVRLEQVAARLEVVEQLRGLPGVREVSIVSGEQLAYLQVDDEVFDPGSLESLPVVIAN